MKFHFEFSREGLAGESGSKDRRRAAAMRIDVGVKPPSLRQVGLRSVDEARGGGGGGRGKRKNLANFRN